MVSLIVLLLLGHRSNICNLIQFGKNERTYSGSRKAWFGQLQTLESQLPPLTLLLVLQPVSAVTRAPEGGNRSFPYLCCFPSIWRGWQQQVRLLESSGPSSSPTNHPPVLLFCERRDFTHLVRTFTAAGFMLQPSTQLTATRNFTALPVSFYWERNGSEWRVLMWVRE